MILLLHISLWTDDAGVFNHYFWLGSENLFHMEEAKYGVEKLQTDSSPFPVTLSCPSLPLKMCRHVNFPRHLLGTPDQLSLSHFC